MAFREVPMFEVREVLRLWLGGEGLRAVARLSRVDRKTVRRDVDAAVEAGVCVDGGVEQLTDEVLGRVVEIVRPHRVDGHGAGWAMLSLTERRAGPRPPGAGSPAGAVSIRRARPRGTRGLTRRTPATPTAPRQPAGNGTRPKGGNSTGRQPGVTPSVARGCDHSHGAARRQPEHAVIPDPATRACITADEAFAELGIDRTTGYRAIKDGTFPVPVIRVGRLIRVPTAALRRLLDADDDLENPTVTDQYDDDPTTEPPATPALRLVPRPEMAHQRTQAAPRPERNGGHP